MFGAFVNGKFQMFPEMTAESYGGVRASTTAYDADSEVPGISRRREATPPQQRQLPAGRTAQPRRVQASSGSAQPLSPRAKIVLGIGTVVAAIAVIAWGETRWRDGMIDRMTGKGEGATVPLWSRIGAKATAAAGTDALRKAARAKKRKAKAKAKPIETDEKKREDEEEDEDEDDEG